LLDTIHDVRHIIKHDDRHLTGVVSTLLDRVDLDPALLEDVILGCALATQCIGGGQGIATILERV
jgi:acetyl-CoA acetyltransferase